MAKSNQTMFRTGGGDRIAFQHDDLTAALAPKGLKSENLGPLLLNLWLHLNPKGPFAVNADGYLKLFRDKYKAKPSSVIQTAIAFGSGLHADLPIPKNEP